MFTAADTKSGLIALYYQNLTNRTQNPDKIFCKILDQEKKDENYEK